MKAKYIALEEKKRNGVEHTVALTGVLTKADALGAIQGRTENLKTMRRHFPAREAVQHTFSLLCTDNASVESAITFGPEKEQE